MENNHKQKLLKNGYGCYGWGKRCRDYFRTIRFGILLIIIGFLWYGQRAGWFDSYLFGPMVLLVIGVWLVLVGLKKRYNRSDSLSQG